MVKCNPCHELARLISALEDCLPVLNNFLKLLKCWFHESRNDFIQVFKGLLFPHGAAIASLNSERSSQSQLPSPLPALLDISMDDQVTRLSIIQLRNTVRQNKLRRCRRVNRFWEEFTWMMWKSTTAGTVHSQISFKWVGKTQPNFAGIQVHAGFRVMLSTASMYTLCRTMQDWLPRFSDSWRCQSVPSTQSYTGEFYGRQGCAVESDKPSGKDR